MRAIRPNSTAPAAAVAGARPAPGIPAYPRTFRTEPQTLLRFDGQARRVFQIIFAIGGLIALANQP